jgi:hypothetical protein
VAGDHTIVFTTPTGVPNGGSFTIDFSAFTGTSSIAVGDIDVATTSDFTLAADCTGSEEVSASFGATDEILTFTFCSGDGGSIPANGTTTIQIGQNASGGSNQLVNPTTGSYTIDLTTSSGDSGTTRVAIVDTVTVTASVDTVFNFTVSGVASGQTVNGTTTGTTTTATEIGFGILNANEVRTGAQDLQVETNAKNGFTVTVVSDGQLDSTTGADIDSFSNGGDQAVPIAWAVPTATIGSENTYGHWGVTSDDTDIFAATETYKAVLTTPVSVFDYTGPTTATTTRVGYTVQVSALQEAADDYQAVLTYIATPVF